MLVLICVASESWPSPGTDPGQLAELACRWIPPTLPEFMLATQVGVVQLNKTLSL